MKVDPFKRIIWSWIMVVVAGSIISQYPPENIPMVYAIWCVLIAAASVGTAKAYTLKDEKQKNLWLFWLLLCLAVFIENVLVFFVPALQFLTVINIYALWSIALGFGYLYTAKNPGWNELKMYGYISILSSILFYLPPVIQFPAFVFGLVQGGLMLILVRK